MAGLVSIEEWPNKRFNRSRGPRNFLISTLVGRGPVNRVVRQPEIFAAMSIYGYLNCHDCRHTLFLGKALHCNYRPCAFHIGGPEEPAHWARQQLNQVLWKFLADHSGHRIDVRLEHEMTDEMFGYQDIGGDTDDDLSFETYLAGWPGLVLGSEDSS